MSLDIRDAVQRPCRRLAPATVMTSAWVSVSPRASRPSAGSASRAASTTPPSAASPISPPGCVATPRPLAGARSPIACSQPDRATCGVGIHRRCPAQRIQPLGAGSQRQRIQRRHSEHDDTTRDTQPAGSTTVAARRSRALPLLRRSAADDAERLGVHAARTWTDESVVVVPSISIERTTARQRHRHAGAGGTSTVPAAAACASRGCA